DDRARAAVQRAREEALAQLRTSLVAKELLIRILRHAVRDPLTAAVSGVELALRLPSERSQASLASAAASARRMARMIDDLLDQTRSHSGHRIPIERKRVDLAA